MRYSLHETDSHDVVATTVAADRDEALEWCGILCAGFEPMPTYQYRCEKCGKKFERTELA